MWLGEPGSDVASQITGPWGFLAVLVLVGGSLAGIWLKARVARAPAREAIPAATQTAETAVSEYREMTRVLLRQYKEDIAKARSDADEARRARVLAERQQAEAERRAEGLAADLAEANDRLYQCNERLQHALRPEAPDDRSS